jgi:hypothetical protein
MGIVKGEDEIFEARKSEPADLATFRARKRGAA